MVFSHMSKNFTNSVKSRPPLVVFTICLLGIIVTTFCLAYYVDSQDKIPNVDAKDDWISLLAHMNKVEICLENTNGPVFKSTKKDITETVSIMSQMKVLDLSPKQNLNVQGFVSLEGWSSKCSEEEKVPTHLQIAFTLPKTDGNNTKNDENICVTLTGPADFMPKIIGQVPCGSALKSKQKKWAKLTTKSSSMEERDFCKSGSLGKLQHDLDYTKNLNFDMFLSREDRLLINSHLIVVSCFLLFIVVLITCYALLKSRSSSAGDSKQHLMAKGMYL